MGARGTRWFLWIGAVIVPVLLLWWAFAPRPIDVETALVQEGTFVRTLDAEGRTRVRERYVVSAPLTGQLLRVTVKAGDSVAAGELLAVIRPNPPSLLDARTVRELEERVGAAEADVARADASAARAQAALALAQSERARTRDLDAKGFVSKQALDRAEREVDIRERELGVAHEERHAATHQLSVARAALLSARPGARDGQSAWQVRAPVAGRVLRIVQQSETAVAAGAAVVEIGDPADLEIIADVLTIDAVAIPPGAPVEFRQGDAGAVLRGRVRLIEPGAFTKVSALGVEEQRVWVVMDFTEGEQGARALGDAYRLDARIQLERRERALLVPVTALFRDGERWVTFVQDGNRARKREIGIDARSSTLAVVTRGVTSGEHVVVYPADTLNDGARIRVRSRG